MGLDYSYYGATNRDLFYGKLNTINIYVEDRYKEYEYETIFERLLGKSIKIETLYGVGGKENLIRAYEDKRGESTKQKNIFIADLDFDHILNKRMIEDDCFIYLDQYCIENYLVDKVAVNRFMKGRVKKTFKEVEEIIQYDHWFDNITNDFYKLFILFMVVQDKNIGIENVSHSEHKYLDNTDRNTWRLSDYEYNKYYDNVKEILPNIDQLIKEMDYKVSEELKLDKHTVISGKNYIASLKKYLSNFTTRTISEEDFKTVLFHNFDVNNLTFIKTKLEFILNNDLV